MSSLQEFKSGRCPKCSSNDVYTSKNKRNFGYRSYLVLSPFSVGVPLDTYVCLTCGYVEDYLSEKNSKNSKLIDKAIQILKNKWRKVNL